MRINRLNSWLIALTSLSLTLFAAPAQATTDLLSIPDAYSQVQVTGMGLAAQGTPPQSASYFTSNTPTLVDPAKANVYAGTPVVTASAKAQTRQVGAISLETYFFTINGPANVTNIPVTFSGVLTVGVENGALYAGNNGNGFAEAVVSVTSNAGAASIAEACGTTAILANCGLLQLPINTATRQLFIQSPSVFPQRFSYIENLSLNSNSLYAVTMEAYASALPGQQAYALADPAFQITPSFLAENPGYTFEFSKGIVNASLSVPEPSTWVMLLLGFSAVAFFGYRRKARLELASAC